jgi:hypothetical protein
LDRFGATRSWLTRVQPGRRTYAAWADYEPGA